MCRSCGLPAWPGWCVTAWTMWTSCSPSSSSSQTPSPTSGPGAGNIIVRSNNDISPYPSCRGEGIPSPDLEQWREDPGLRPQQFSASHLHPKLRCHTTNCTTEQSYDILLWCLIYLGSFPLFENLRWQKDDVWF